MLYMEDITGRKLQEAKIKTTQYIKEGEMLYIKKEINESIDEYLIDNDDMLNLIERVFGRDLRLKVEDRIADRERVEYLEEEMVNIRYANEELSDELNEAYDKIRELEDKLLEIEKINKKSEEAFRKVLSRL